MELAGYVPTSVAMHIATGMNRVVLGPRHKGVTTDGGSKEQMANVEQEVAMGEARDIRVARTEIAPKTITETETETKMGALATND